MKKNLLLFGMVFLGFFSPKTLLASAIDSALVNGYQVIHLSIATDDFSNAKLASDKLQTDVQKWIDEKGSADPQYPNVSQMRSGLDAIKLSTKEKEFRTAFGLLSQGVVQFIRADVTLQSAWQLFFCPMTSDYPYWVQPKNETIANPYMGHDMLSCGSKKKWSTAWS